MKKHCGENCDNCVYVGEGGFMCEITNKIVIDDFIPTEDYMSNCKLKEHKGR